jgi:hypothetical protein
VSQSALRYWIAVTTGIKTVHEVCRNALIKDLAERNCPESALHSTAVLPSVFHYIPFITGPTVRVLCALHCQSHFSGCPNCSLPVALLCCSDIACSQIILGTLPTIGAILSVTNEQEDLTAM